MANSVLMFVPSMVNTGLTFHMVSILGEMGHSPLSRSVWMAIAFGAMRGIIAGFESMSFNIIWPNYFGRQYLGSIRGYAQAFSVIGSAFGPLPFGVAYDYFHGYTEVILLMVLFPSLTIIASALAKPPAKERVV